MKKTATAILTIASFVFASAAFATMDLQKDCNAKNPDAKANCKTCHVDGKAKKGEPNLNDTGKEVVAATKDKKVDWTKVKSLAPKKG